MCSAKTRTRENKTFTKCVTYIRKANWIFFVCLFVCLLSFQYSRLEGLSGPWNFWLTFPPSLNQAYQLENVEALIWIKSKQNSSYQIMFEGLWLKFYKTFTRPWKNVYFPASWAKFPSSRADFPPVWVGFPYVFLYFFLPNHNISRQGASHFACFFHTWHLH